MSSLPLKGLLSFITYLAFSAETSFAHPLDGPAFLSTGPQANATISASLSQASKPSSRLPVAPSQSPSPSLTSHPQLRPAKASGISPTSEYTVQIRTEQATDCNEFPDPGYGGSDAPNYKYWPISTVLNVSCFLDVTVDSQNYTWLKTKDPKTGDACWVDEMNIIEPQTVMAMNGSVVTAAPLPPPAATPKPTTSSSAGLGDSDGYEGEELENPDEDEDEDPRKKKKPGVELSEVLPQCTRPRPYQVWTTRNDYLLSKDGFWMSCYARPEIKSKKYEVQWGARHVWCYRDGEQVGGKKRWWRDAHVLETAPRGSSLSEGFMSRVSHFLRINKKEEHCWIPEDSLDDMVFSIPGAGGKCKD